MRYDKYLEKLENLKWQLENGKITQAEYNDKEMELYRYWLAYGCYEE